MMAHEAVRISPPRTTDRGNVTEDVVSLRERSRTASRESTAMRKGLRQQVHFGLK